MVMVTHRLGVIRRLDVNRVVVMDQGKIAEEGHPEELLRKPNGLYANLAREQGIFPLRVVEEDTTDDAVQVNGKRIVSATKGNETTVALQAAE